MSKNHNSLRYWFLGIFLVLVLLVPTSLIILIAFTGTKYTSLISIILLLFVCFSVFTWSFFLPRTSLTEDLEPKTESQIQAPTVEKWLQTNSVPKSLLTAIEAEKMRKFVQNYPYNSQTKEIIDLLKIWTWENRIELLDSSKFTFLPSEIQNNFYHSILLRRLFKKLLRSNFGVDDLLFFWFQNRPVELLNLYNPYTEEHYLALCAQNPDEIEGQTLVYSTSYLDYTLKEKIITESLEFNKVFYTSSTSQLSARMHLKTNVMQDMLDMKNHLHGRQVIFYFDNSTMYIIFETGSNALEPNFYHSFLEEEQVLDILDELNLALSIFDHFWLSRKVYFE